MRKRKRRGEAAGRSTLRSHEHRSRRPVLGSRVFDRRTTSFAMFTALSSAATYRVCAAADAGAGARASNKNKQHATTAPSALYSHRRWGFSGAGAGAAREAIHTRAAGSDAAPAIAPAHLRTTVTPVPPEIMAEGKGRFFICPHTCPRPSFQQYYNFFPEPPKACADCAKPSQISS